MKIYLDLDGVLTDFNSSIQTHFNCSSKEFFTAHSEEEAWSLINDIDHFWLTMKWMKDGKKLWSEVLKIDPSVEILTTPADSVKQCYSDKKEWVKTNLGSGHKINFSANKEEFATQDSILIDDKEENVHAFISSGGKGIVHKNTNSTLEQLEKIIKENKKKSSMQINSTSFIFSSESPVYKSLEKVFEKIAQENSLKNIVHINVCVTKTASSCNFSIEKYGALSLEEEEILKEEVEELISTLDAAWANNTKEFIQPLEQKLRELLSSSNADYNNGSLYENGYEEIWSLKTFDVVKKGPLEYQVVE